MMVKNEVSKLCKTMKMSKYNIIVSDKDGNLIIYNFLVGIPSLIKIMKSDVDTFNSLFLESDEIKDSDCMQHMELTKKLLELGILVDRDINEGVLYEEKAFEEIYDNRLHLTILPTGRCNFNCSYCIEAEQSFCRERMTVKNQEAVIKYVQKNIHKYTGLHVAWFGGEPLLEASMIHELSEKLIKICNARCIPYTAETTTNGFFLDADTFDMLYRDKIYEYMITIDGFKKQHDKSRFLHNGAGTYDVIMKNLIDIRDNKQHRFANIIVRVNITREVLMILDDFIQYLDDTFSGDSRFTFLFIPVVNYSKTKPNDDTFVSAKEVMEKLNNNSLYVEKFMPSNTNMGLITPTTNCLSSLKNSYVITSDLKIYKCVAHFDMDDNYIGFIDAQGNMKLDEALDKKWYLTSEFLCRASDSCVECFYRPVCQSDGRNCPYKYLNNSKKYIDCPLKEDGFVEALKTAIIDLSDKLTGYVVTLKSKCI